MKNEEELQRCKQLVVSQLETMEAILRTIKQMNEMAHLSLDTSGLENEIILVYEEIEND